jgi:Flp pilus assembly protein TadD
MRFLFALAFLLIPASAAAAPKPVDALFSALAKTSSPEDAKPIEEQIEALFQQSGSPSVDLLMARAASAVQGGDADTAKKLLASITSIAPDFAEGWHSRAQVQAATGDDEGAMVSLQKTVTLNPRQFTALAELAGMLADYGDKSAALATYRKALALDPHMDGVERHVRELSRAVEGDKI